LTVIGASFPSTGPRPPYRRPIEHDRSSKTDLDKLPIETQASNDVGRIALYGCALTIYPVVGVLLLLVNQAQLSHESNTAWPLVLFCVGLPLVLAAVTSTLARLSLGAAALMLVIAGMGGLLSIFVLLSIAAASGSLS
jgi:hypothetical protein